MSNQVLMKQGGFDKVTNNAVFFWGGVFSNWYGSPFAAKSMEGRMTEMDFNCQEQYMMFQKAIAFNDLIAAVNIMNEDSPQKQKAMGRKIRNYDDKHWAEIRFNVTFPGIIAKFEQNPSLKDVLMATGDRTIVEASPEDAIWGIGMGSGDPNLMDRARWGENLLGKQLMSARELFRRKH